MITTQEILERSIYEAILNEALRQKVTLDPAVYHPVTPETEKQYKEDLKAIPHFVSIFGPGNSQSKGAKVTPRIVVDTHGFFPGGIGLPGYVEEKQDGVYRPVEVPHDTLDQFVDIRLVSNNQEENRLLHQLMFFAIPQKGYIKPFYADKLEKTGNIFIELVNFNDQPNLDQGFIEKVYQFAIYDCLLVLPRALDDITPIKDITVDLQELILNTKK